MSDFIVIQRTGVEGHGAAQKFSGESPLFFIGQRLEGIQKLGCLVTHILRLNSILLPDKRQIIRGDASVSDIEAEGGGLFSAGALADVQQGGVVEDGSHGVADLFQDAPGFAILGVVALGADLEGGFPGTG